MQVIYGINPLKEALKIEPPIVKKIFFSRQPDKEVALIEQMAASQGVPVEHKEKTYLKNVLRDETHQGVAGICRDFNYTAFDKLINSATASSGRVVLLLLDEISDPQNLGAIIRTAHCCGINGIIIPEKRACPVTPAVMKASVGAVFFTPVARVTNLAKTIDALKEDGFWVYGSNAETGTDIRQISFGDKIALVVGSEGKGMRELVTKKCDFMLSIPMVGKIDSLNVAVATSIAIYEIQRCFLA